MNTFDCDRTYIANTYNRQPVEIVSGEGALLKGSDGREYIDMGSGIAVNIFGVNDRQWKEAVISQLDQVQHASNIYYTRPQAELAKELCERTGMKKVFFANSGAEANECAIKTARKYSSDKYGDEARPTIITLKNSFHGRTLATLTATGQDVFHHHFGPFPAGFVYADTDDAAGVIKAIENGAAALMMEMVQGEGGVMPLDRGFVSEAVSAARANDTIVIVDEVQTGNGRTGTLYAYEQYSIQPDIVTTAKGIGGGLPIGAAILGDKVKDTLTPGTHGSTFGGNPVAAAGALSILSRIDGALLSDVKRKSRLIFESLEGQPGIESVSGMGLMIGIKTSKSAADIVAEARQKGVLLLTAKDKVRLLPPLNITYDQLKKAIEVIREAACE